MKDNRVLLEIDQTILRAKEVMYHASCYRKYIQEMEDMKINGRPYHPQSQGRVERLKLIKLLRDFFATTSLS